MISKNQVRLIRSLHQKKYRIAHGIFIAEGVKTVRDFLASGMDIQAIYATQEWHRTVHKDLKISVLPEEISEQELKQISFLSTPNQVLALVKIPVNIFDPACLMNETVIGLDQVQDPGNMGTIIRLADWFGIRHMLCNPNTVDPYNPKVVQASMGSLARVKVHSLDLEGLLASHKGFPVVGTSLSGRNIYHESLPEHGLYLFGNEASGLSESLKKHLSQEVMIPAAPGRTAVDSINVSTAAAIVLYELGRSLSR